MCAAIKAPRVTSVINNSSNVSEISSLHSIRQKKKLSCIIGRNQLNITNTHKCITSAEEGMCHNIWGNELLSRGLPCCPCLKWYRAAFSDTCAVR